MDAAITMDDAIEENQANYSFAHIFENMLLDPIHTLHWLKTVPKGHGIHLSSFLVVVVSASIIALVRASGTVDFLAFFKYLGAFADGIFSWVMLNCILMGIAKFLKVKDITWRTSQILTGWSFAPLFLVAPCACFINGTGLIIIGMLPLIWCMVLQWYAFKTALDLGHYELLIMVLVIPPIVFLVDLFWFGFLFCIILAQLAAISLIGLS